MTVCRIRQHEPLIAIAAVDPALFPDRQPNSGVAQRPTAAIATYTARGNILFFRGVLNG
jgi:hypothetical protein